MRIRIVLLLLCFFVGIAQGRPTEDYTRQILFEAGKDGYHTYRIPALATSKNGTLLAFCAARQGRGGDWDPIDIVMRRRSDGGKTWSPMQLIAHGDGVPCDNATIVIDDVTGEVHLLYQIDYARCYYIRSADDGKSWSKAEDITHVIDKFQKVYPWNVLAPGPGHGIQLTNGRLVVPFWLSNGGKSHHPSCVVSVYSDDHGRTWKAGEIAVPDNDVTVIPSETCCVQLADGRVMFNSRNESPNYRRLVTYSADGATGWSQPVFADAFFEPICQAGMCRYDMQSDKSKNGILFCNPDSRQYPGPEYPPATPRSAKSRHRVNLTVRMSYDEGVTWPVAKVIDPGISGYSDITVTTDGRIRCLYEGATDTGTRCLILVSFTLDRLTSGKYGSPIFE